MISVIIAAYNAEEFIEDVLDAILLQTRMPHEIIVVNDGSKDSTLKILRKYPKDIKPTLKNRFKRIKNYKVINQKNKGPAGASNAAIKAAEGDYIVSVDSDAILEENFIERAVDALKKHPDVGVVGGYIGTANPRSFWARMMGYDLEYRYAHIGRRKSKKALVEHVSPNSTVYRKEIFKKAGYFDESYHYCQDVDFSYRVAEAGYKIMLLKDIGSKHYWRESFAGYTKQQFNVSYWRMKLVRKKPGNVKGDKVSGLRMFIQVPITGIIIILYIASAFHHPLWEAPTVLLGLLLIERYQEALSIMWKKRSISALLMPIVHLWRNLVWGIAGLSYLFGRMLRK